MIFRKYAKPQTDRAHLAVRNPRRLTDTQETLSENSETDKREKTLTRPTTIQQVMSSADDDEQWRVVPSRFLGGSRLHSGPGRALSATQSAIPTNWIRHFCPSLTFYCPFYR